MSKERSKKVRATPKLGRRRGPISEARPKSSLPLPPLSAEEFRSVLEALDSMGLTWTADLPPLMTTKREKLTTDSFSGNAYRDLQERYPSFPHELYHVMLYALTGKKTGPRKLMEESDNLERKAQALRDILITPEYRGEFFFKYAIKVPYFVDIDWEIVIKAFERNVQEMPRIPYALLMLGFRQPTDPLVPLGYPEAPERRRVTVAVNEEMVDTLLESLQQTKRLLREAREIAETIAAKENSNGTDTDTV
jgi:hypothetical protein